jgi:peptidoglycan/LPS O-acetylase OafA/YrhL
MKLSFRRITSSGNFIPEIDGLRFIAIFSVVLFHISEFLAVKDLTVYSDSTDYSVLKYFISHGHLGVPLFYVISGFILGLPFAKFYLADGKPVSIKKYFIRRLTRLEPPYIVVMTVLLFAAVYVAKILPPHKGLISYLASIIYSHNLIFPDVLPELNGAAWSLEIEVQFYILAPVMAYIFSLRSAAKRRFSIILFTVLFTALNQFVFSSLPFISLLNYSQYFLTGFLLADMYVSKSSLFPRTKYDFLTGFFLFILIWIYTDENFTTNLPKFIWELIRLIGIFFFYYYVLFHKTFKFLSLRLITNIGGMCYSIYLLHASVISLFGNYVCRVSFSEYTFINVPAYSLILISAVLTVSSVFFLLVERPCMDRNWYKKIFNRRIN